MSTLDAEDYAHTRSLFRDAAARMALLRESLVEFGFSDETALRMCELWLEFTLKVPNDE